MKFPWWNHWPTADIPSDGRRAVAADRASHSSVLTGSEWADYRVTPTSRQRVMLHGLTTSSAAELVPLARSWLSPAAIEDLVSIVTVARYDVLEKGYVFAAAEGSSEIAFTVAATITSPLLNPAFIFRGWAPRAIEVLIGGRPAAVASYRYGLRHQVAGSDLIVWLELVASVPTDISVRSIG
jgi:hypothetical protein